MIDGSGGSGKDNEFRVFVGHPGIDVHSGVGHVSLKLRSSIFGMETETENLIRV